MSLATLLSKSTPSPVRFVTEESITDRSKSDDFTKLFAIAQCIWLVVGLISRTAAGLPSTQLELATAVYVLCAIATYAFWWYKPFGISHVTIVSHDDNSIQFKFQLKQWKPVSFSPSQELRSINTVVEEFGNLIGLGCTATLFSATHLIAWN